MGKSHLGTPKSHFDFKWFNFIQICVKILENARGTYCAVSTASAHRRRRQPPASGMPLIPRVPKSTILNSHALLGTVDCKYTGIFGLDFNAFPVWCGRVFLARLWCVGLCVQNRARTEAARVEGSADAYCANSKWGLQNTRLEKTGRSTKEC